MISFIKQHKIISSLILINIIVAVIAIITIVMHQVKTAVVDINVVPSVATITLNGREYENSKSHNVLPGDYHVIISMDGMQTKEFDITLENDGFSSIKTYLLDNNNSFDYYLSHPDEGYILPGVVEKNDKVAMAFIAKFDAIASILDELPLIEEVPSPYGDLYGSKHMFDKLIIENNSESETCNEGFCLLITDTVGDRQEHARELIQKLGYDPNNYYITYEKVDYDQE